MVPQNFDRLLWTVKFYQINWEFEMSPTSVLDSTSALMVIKVLQQIARTEWKCCDYVNSLAELQNSQLIKSINFLATWTNCLQRFNIELGPILYRHELIRELEGSLGETEVQLISTQHGKLSKGVVVLMGALSYNLSLKKAKVQAFLEGNWYLVRQILLLWFLLLPIQYVLKWSFC